MMTRRTCFPVFAAALAADWTLMGKENGKDDTMRELLEISQNEKKGVMLYVKGQSLAGAVTKLTADTVELRSREYSRIVVRIESIDAAAMA
jgi:hypothetical protein